MTASAIPDSKHTSLRSLFREAIRGRFSRGLGMSYTNTLVAAFVSMAIIPVYLHFLGSAEYGLWITVSGLVSYLNLTNFGVTQSTANLFGQHMAAGRLEDARQAFAGGFTRYLRIASSVAAVCIV